MAKLKSAPTKEAVQESKTGIPRWVWAQKSWAGLLEKIFLWIEGPVNRFSGTTQLNPFYHTGTIAVFLLGLIAISGLYLYIFFHYGFDRSYISVGRLEGQPFGRFMRALHRYASGALIITTFFHATRILFMERFRGPRWLAWVTGHAMLAMMWAAGLTGYWLIWDGRAQLITDRGLAFVETFTPWYGQAANWLIALEQGRSSWLLMFLILASHVLLFFITAGFFYLHIIRLKRAKWIPELPSIIGMGVVLFAGSLLFPAGMLAQADPTQMPASITYDPIFLFFFPASGTAGWLAWAVLLGIGLLLTLMPWLSRPTHHVPPVEIIENFCTGCTRCAIDCPYGAIEMVPLDDQAVHNYLAVVDPALCVACGICLGSCTDDALRLGEVDAPLLKQQVLEKIRSAQEHSGRPDDVEIVFTCSRFANQGARRYLYRANSHNHHLHATVELVVVSCAGAVPPDLLVDALDAGAAEVRLIGCPPDDCLNREGNSWAEQRLTRERPPRLRKRYAEVPISAVWLPPDQFEEGLQADVQAKETGWLETRRLLQTLTWRNFVPAFVLLGAVLLVQILTNDLFFVPAYADQGTVEIVLPNTGRPLGWAGIGAGTFRGGDHQLWLAIDGQKHLLATLPSKELFSTEPLAYYERWPVSTGPHDLVLTLVNPQTGATFFLDQRREIFGKGQIIRLKDQTGLADKDLGDVIGR